MIENQEIQKEELKQKAERFGCEISEDQILFFVAHLEKEFIFNNYLQENGLEFINERTKKSISDEFDALIFAPENKDRDFKEILHSIVTDENGEILWELFDPGSKKKHNLSINGSINGLVNGGEINYVDISKILPPAGSIDSAANANPFTKEYWDMTKQARIFKENPEIAKYLSNLANPAR